MMQVLWGVGSILNPTAAAAEVLPYLLSIDVRKTLYDTTDTFECTFALFGESDASYSFWGNLTGMVVKIQLSCDMATPNGRVPFIGWTTILNGIVNNIKQDAFKGIVTITGRDLAAVFNDFHLNQTYTEADVGDTLAAIISDHGFKPDVTDVNGKTFGVQRNDEKNYQTLGTASRELREADLMSKLKNDYGAVAWLDPDGVTYHVNVAPTGEQWIINVPPPVFLGGATQLPPANWEKLSFNHNLLYAIGANSVVGARTHSQEKVGEVIAYPEGAALGSDSMPVMLDFHGLTTEDAHEYAENHLKNYIGKEWTFDWETGDPALLNFKVTDTFLIQGTNSLTDGPYGLDSIQYNLDAKRGLRFLIKGKAGQGDSDTPGVDSSGG